MRWRRMDNLESFMYVESLKVFVTTMEARLVRLEKACLEVKGNIEAAKQMIAQEALGAPAATPPATPRGRG